MQSAQVGSVLAVSQTGKAFMYAHRAILYRSRAYVIDSSLATLSLPIGAQLAADWRLIRPREHSSAYSSL
jgi:hypothetical protein